MTIRVCVVIGCNYCFLINPRISFSRATATLLGKRVQRAPSRNAINLQHLECFVFPFD